MTARQICNAAYAFIVAYKDDAERRAFDTEINADPTRGPVSHGTGALAALFGGLIAPPSAAPGAAE